MNIQTKKDMVDKMRLFLTMYHFTTAKSKEQYRYDCPECGKQTLYGQKPNEMLYPKQFFCLTDECLENICAKESELTDIFNLLK
jgi:peptide subunit release factor 1 (eRF1)